MTTVRDLIYGSLKDLGAIGVEETPSAAEAEDGLVVLNQLIQTWQTERLVVYAQRQQEFTYPVTGQESYTLGPSGDLVGQRPVRIEAALNRDANGNDYWFYVAKDYSDYAQIITKNVSAQLQAILYYDPTLVDGENGTLYLWPTPSDSSYHLVLWDWYTVAEFASLDDVIQLPPGYERALRTNLAVELSPRYGRNLMPALTAMAVSSKAQIKRTNLTIATLRYDYGMGKKGIMFNYLTGQPT